MVMTRDAAYRQWSKGQLRLSHLGFHVRQGFEAGWHARDEEIAQLRAIAERGATDLDLAAATLLAHPELDRDIFINSLRRQARHIRNALAANVPASERWQEGRP
jgi:hypothetical protein